jgi:FMN phosphatase YigB (HAD superfamily)
MIKAIIFDWGRTIYDKENEKLFLETKKVLKHCFEKYDLALVSLAIDDDIEGRFSKIEGYDIRKYFKFMLFHVSDKNSLFRNAIGNLKLKPQEILVVDDMMRRLASPISLGCLTIWVRKGKLATEDPDESTGNPNYIVNSLAEILEII